FKATSGTDGNLIKWGADGIGEVYFEIEKSADGTKWSHLAKIKSVNLNTGYQYLDKNPEPLTYYKIKLYNLDGKFTESEIVSVRTQSLRNIPLFFPNPAKNEIK